MKRIFTLAVLILFVATTSVFASQKGSMKSESMKKKTMDRGSMAHDHQHHQTDGVSKAKVHAAMLNYIAQQTGDHDEYFLDGTKTKFGYLHKGLKDKGGAYVSCVDFVAGDDIYDVDYYVEKHAGHYHVTKEILHKKNGQKINKVLWSKDNMSGSVIKGSIR